MLSSIVNRSISHILPLLEKWVLKKGYDPNRYWTLRGRFFHLEEYQRALGWQHPWIVSQLNKMTWNKLLEIGCGFGRNLQFLRKQFPHQELVGIDFSPPLLRQAQKRLANSDVQLLEGSALTLPVLPTSIDVVLTMGLFMHILPQDIATAVSQVTGLDVAHFLIIEQNDSQLPRRKTESIPINPFTFSHDYQHLFSNSGSELVEKETRGDLTAFYFKKRNL